MQGYVKLFNFRQVLKACGMQLDDVHLNWKVGQLLTKIAARRGLPVQRLLTEKTSSSPSVRAPHCIAHYPMAMFAEAKREVDALVKDRARQVQLPL